MTDIGIDWAEKQNLLHRYVESPGDLEKCSHISPFKCILREIISRLPLKALIEAIGYRKELGFSYKLVYGTFENRLRKQPILFHDL